jgi:hypothetical protein
MSSGMTGRAVEAAVSVAAEHGLGCDEPRVLGHLSNVLVHLAPYPVVARVATLMGELRNGDAGWLRREVSVIEHLRGRDAVAPSTLVPPGPHLRDGLAMSFVALEHVDPAARLDPADVGRSLRRLHTHLADMPVQQLPYLGMIGESGAWLGRLPAAPDLAGDTIARVRDLHDELTEAIAALRPHAQPLHGDAHAANVMATPRGLVWTDFEDVTLGPPHWDLACLVARARALGMGEGRYDQEWADTAVRAYGSDPREPMLDLLVDARVLAVAAWGLAAGPARPGLRDVSLARLSWLLGRHHRQTVRRPHHGS